MSFDLGESYSEFQLLQRESISELNSLALLFTHLKTGEKRITGSPWQRYRYGFSGSNDLNEPGINHRGANH